MHKLINRDGKILKSDRTISDCASSKQQSDMEGAQTVDLATVLYNNVDLKQEPTDQEAEDIRYYDLNIEVKLEEADDLYAEELIKELYKDHKIKNELVIGPEVLQQSRSAPNCADGVNVSSEQETQHHTRPARGKSEFICDICQKCFHYKSDIISHLHSHSNDNIDNEGLFHCVFCNQQFKRKARLLGHEFIHTGVKPFQCKNCNKQFIRQIHLNRHESIHLDANPFQRNCNKQFAKKTRRKYFHAGVKRFSCNFCIKQFTTRTVLINHERVHTGEKPFQCNICKKQFTEKSTLNRHKHVHTGVKPYSCNICNQQFTRKTSVARHEHIHTGLKSFSCNICNKQFTRKWNMIQHERIHTGANFRKPKHHSVEKKFICDFCSVQFTSKRKLSHHLSTCAY